MTNEVPADPWASPLAEVETNTAGQSARAMAVEKLRGAHKEGLVGGIGQLGVAKSWAKGAVGESRVGVGLARLPFGWTVIHDLTIPGTAANVDHLVLGPPGVFSINTKNHSGRKVWVGEHRILVNGHKTDHIRKARWEAREVGKLLGGQEVTWVIAIFCKEMTVRQQPKDLKVVDARFLSRWLLQRERRFGQDTLDGLRSAVASWIARK